MFEQFCLSPSGVKIYTAIDHNLAGFDRKDTSHPHYLDVQRKRFERGRAIQSENSEDAVTFSFFHACSKLPSKAWLLDFFRVAISTEFAESYASLIDTAAVRFWRPYPAPQAYQEWLRARLLAKGEKAIEHLEYDARLRAKERLQKILAGDTSEMPERPTETDVEIRIGNELLVFVEAKLFSDISTYGTFSPGRDQIVRNLELVGDVAAREGIRDFRLILLTLDRSTEKLYTRAMKRYRWSDMRRLRSWDEVGRWEAVKRALPHRSTEADDYFKRLTLSMGWALWPECLKILAHHAFGGSSRWSP